MKQLNHRQSGFVAILTVMFFITLISVLTLGFLRVMLDERRQSVDNDLTATALNAAEAGIEDGKRLLLYCANNPGVTECDIAFQQEACPGVFSSAALGNALGISGAVDPTDGSVSVASGSDFEQQYTCLLVNPVTDDYEAPLEAGQTDLVPLKSEGGQPINRVELSWHMTTSGAQGPPMNYPANKDYLPSTVQWEGASVNDKLPSYMRASYLVHDADSINLQTLDNDSRTVFLTPLNSGSSTVNTPTEVILNNVDVRTGAKTKTQPAGVQCIAPPGGAPAAQRYACRVSIQLGSSVSADRAAYLRVTALYGATDFKVSMFNNNTLVRFDGAQPIIDATGRSNDVFRRVQARVRLDQQAFYPQYALESGKDLCKNFLVTSNAANFYNYCPIEPTTP